MKPLIKFFIVTGIILFSLKLGCNKLSEAFMEQNMTEICGYDYEDALKELDTDQCPNAGSVEELQKIYKKHAFWPPTEEQERRFRLFLRNPCEAPPDPKNQLQSGLKELWEVTILFYFAYCIYTIPMTIVIIILIIKGIVDKSTTAVEVAIKDIKDKPNRPDKKQVTQDRLEEDLK